jgi:hypothetical protein
MTAHHLSLQDDDQPRRQPSPRNAVINQFFKWLTTLLKQLKSAASSLQALYTAAQGMIATLELKVTSLETLVQTSQVQELVCSSSLVVVQASIDLVLPESDTPPPASAPTASSPFPYPPSSSPPSYPLQSDSPHRC